MMRLSVDGNEFVGRVAGIGSSTVLPQTLVNYKGLGFPNVAELVAKPIAVSADSNAVPDATRHGARFFSALSKS